MTDDIKLPPLHYDEMPEYGDAIPAMYAYARRAIKADRQQRGEPSEDLMDALRNQRQIDRDGSEVGVSRQALDEAIALLDRYGDHHVAQQSAPEPMKYDGKRDDRYVTGWNDCLAGMLAAAPKFGEEE